MSTAQKKRLTLVRACQGYSEAKGGLNKPELCRLLVKEFPVLKDEDLQKKSREEIQAKGLSEIEKRGTSDFLTPPRAPRRTNQLPTSLPPQSQVSSSLPQGQPSPPPLPKSPPPMFLSSRPPDTIRPEEWVDVGTGLNLKQVLEAVPSAQKTLDETNWQKIEALCKKSTEFKQLCQSRIMDPIWKEKVRRECPLTIDLNKFTLADFNRRFTESGAKYRNFYSIYLKCKKKTLNRENLLGQFFASYRLNNDTTTNFIQIVGFSANKAIVRSVPGITVNGPSNEKRDKVDQRWLEKNPWQSLKKISQADKDKYFHLLISLEPDMDEWILRSAGRFLTGVYFKQIDKNQIVTKQLR